MNTLGAPWGTRAFFLNALSHFEGRTLQITGTPLTGAEMSRGLGNEARTLVEYGQQLSLEHVTQEKSIFEL